MVSLVGLTAALVMALAGAQAISAGTLPAGLYPAKAPAPGTGAPLRVPAGVGSSNTAASAHGLVCYGVQGFKSEANSRYVAAELGYGPFKYPRQNLYGMLRARATTVGAWEKHQFCYDEHTKIWWIFTNANGRWASTEMNYSGNDKYMLRARAESIGLYEQYRIDCIKESLGRSRSTQPQAADTWQPNLTTRVMTMACCVPGQARWARGRNSFPSSTVSSNYPAAASSGVERGVTPRPRVAADRDQVSAESGSRVRVRGCRGRVGRGSQMRGSQGRRGWPG